jgi:D-alanyl-D-alanine carboxypeptidase (penicillin-binding protein 5/6)
VRIKKYVLKVSRVTCQFVALVALSVSHDVAMSQMISGAALSNIPSPVLEAKSWILIEHGTGTILAHRDANLRVEPASLTKLMVSYVVFDRLSNGSMALDDEVLVSEKAWRTGGSRMFIEVGKRVTVHDLLKGLIIQSGNDAAVALAEYVAGTEIGFATLMNHKALELGMMSSNFTNAPGLPGEEHYSTVYDIALLSRALIKDFPEFYAWYSEPEFTFNDITQRNRNTLLARDPSVDGIKTGYTEAAGYCLAASSVKNEMRLIAIVAGASSPAARAEQVASLLNFGHAAYMPLQILRESRPDDTLNVYYGEVDELAYGMLAPTTLVIAKELRDSLMFDYRVPAHVEAPVAEGDVVGSARVLAGDEELVNFELASLHSVAEAGLIKKIADYFRLQIASF